MSILPPAWQASLHLQQAEILITARDNMGCGRGSAVWSTSQYRSKEQVIADAIAEAQVDVKATRAAEAVWATFESALIIAKLSRFNRVHRPSIVSEENGSGLTHEEMAQIAGTERGRGRRLLNS